MNRAYIRVSTAQQEANLSLAAQKRTIKDFVKNEKVLFYQDIASGRSQNGRKQLKRMLKDLEKGDRIIVFRLDRISRSLQDLSSLVNTFEKKKVTFCSTRESFDTSSASGKAFLGMLSVFAEFESNVISERTLNSMSVARSRGRWLGGQIPYGWSRRQGKLSRIEGEQKVIELMTEWREKDKWSYDRIAQELTDRLIPTKLNSGRWYGDNINHIIKRNKELKELIKDKV